MLYEVFLSKIIRNKVIFFEKGSTGLNGRLDKKASGMGLYLCKKICTKLSHKITAESGESGTTIKIDLFTKKIGIE